ncbi:undecaprenyl-diphosphatase [Chromohalobacter canadensis]|uniref:Undecaprenyl-diphosphatase n=1 Tax=Chromohalobacter canadensis TaxID=141389 RepID=A0A285VPQ8_9GAMM|nr:bifunctional DedA family/phosphatase PAP2 family protein [Chromohalobacter canadensis]SOC56042.1 undecaprenyl-diphosphatase [Chromohalobacter canadensis]
MNVTEWLNQFSPSPTLLVLIVLLVALLESLAVVGLLVPGIVILTAAASLAGHQHLPLPLLLAAAFAGATLGDGLSFWLGYSQRERVHRLWPFTRHPEWLARGVDFFKRYGDLSILIGRFVGPVRPIVPMVAGMLHMPTWRFAAVNIASALLWAPAYLLPGYLLGHSWDKLLALPASSERWLVTLGLMLIMLGVGFSWFRHHLGRGGWVYMRLARFSRTTPRRRRLWLALGAAHPRNEIPLASLALLVASLVALCGWTLWVLEHPAPSLPMDRQIQALLAPLADSWLGEFSNFMALSGDVLGIIALAMPWLVWLLFSRRIAAFLHISSALVGVGFANLVFKHLAGRARPDTPDYLMGSFSYPSAHTSTSIVLIGLAAAFTAEALPVKRRMWVYWGATLVCLPMALSRLVLGVHWASDLIGGALLGLVVCAITRLSYQRFVHVALTPCPWPPLVVASLLLLAARIVWLPYV